mmetsp:Transcript_35230/g.98981  ORF Transcript_35230/g.98981 Transcript_35230/m.98981 type:complete len:380 (+) Transcript_35230:65-1204(+)
MEGGREAAELLGWTAKQGRIVTANGQAATLYVPERGFPFQPEECPHHHLLQGTTHSAFSSWASQNTSRNLVCGAFFRPLFVGGWEHTSDVDEVVYNVQTNTLFIDMRIPRLGRKLLAGVAGLGEMDADQLKLYARRHAFAGYTRLQHENGRPVCTRHHCVDWNFVGAPRPRPNKWYVEMHPDESMWKEWAYARDDFGQHYYWERWQRLQRDGNGRGFVLAMRKERREDDSRDEIIVAVGDHFSYIRGRAAAKTGPYADKASAVDLVDAAVDAGDRGAAEACLSIDAGHGSVSEGWVIDCALQHWKEGSRLLAGASVAVSGSGAGPCRVLIDQRPWEVYECSVGPEDLEAVLRWGGAPDGGGGDMEAKLLNPAERSPSKL